MDSLTGRLISAIDKFKEGIYSESDFHATIESIRNSATESINEGFFSFLSDIESELEIIDFTVDEKFVRDLYLKQIQRIEIFLHT